MSKNKKILPLTLGALGVVFGDIGTSPLYTMQECIHPVHGVSPDIASNLYGIVSLIFWAMMLVVTLKYVLFLMAADNRGEGGNFALLALLPEKLRVPSPGQLGLVSLMVIAGSALLLGDGVITPAISVLSAVEGLKVFSANLAQFVVPLTVLILFLLFKFQKFGTEKIGNLFGPVMTVWFVSLGGLGLMQVVQYPEIFKALLPTYAFQFLFDNGWHGFRLLGSVVLAITGAEALYSDMGHFGKKPIRMGWLAVAMPCLLLNYFGQAAFLINNPSLRENTFYNLVPEMLHLPMIVLATMATVIASQAMISASFSLAHQAVRLGYLPRMTILHTSTEQSGRIYVPMVNWILAALCILLVMVFQESTKLASAYGLAVTGQMVIVSFIFYAVTKHRFKWKPAASLGILILFLSFDLPLFAANLMKFFDGGYVPLIFGVFFFAVMMFWKKGRTLLGQYFYLNSAGLREFLDNLEKRVFYRIPGCSVFMASNSKGVPPVLHRMVSRFHVLHQNVILLTVTSEDVPYFLKGGAEIDRIETEDLTKGFYRVVVRYGFMENPNIPSIIGEAFHKLNLNFTQADALYVLGHETFVNHNQGSMHGMPQAIFSFLSKNARNATDYFGLPPEQVVELGAQIDL